MVCFSFNEVKTKKTLIGLVLGQIISLLATCISFTTSELTRKGFNAPTSLSFLGFTLLAIFYGGTMVYRKSAIKAKWYHYLLLAFVDMEASFLGESSNRKESPSLWLEYDHDEYRSYQAVKFACSQGRKHINTHRCVLVLTYVFLKTKYRLMKISGVVICILGVVMVVFSDVHAGDRAGGSNPLKGDVLSIVAATLFAVCNVSEEFLVTNAGRIELMSFIGLFGAFFGAIQISIFELDAIKAIQWTTETVVSYIGIASGQVLFYSLLTVLLKTNGTVMFTLSLLTSDMWAVLIRIFAYHEKVDWVYYLAFATTTIGLIIYSMKEKDEEEQSDGRRKLLDDENGESLRRSLVVAST